MGQPSTDNSDRRGEWFFDPISPFAYLHLERLASLDIPISLRFRPLLLVALLKQFGHLGPAEIPAKRQFTYRHVQWRADRLGIPLRFPPAHPFNPLALLRLAVLAGNNFDAIQNLLRSIWRDGELPETPEQLDALGERIGIADASQAITDPMIKAQLLNNADDAIERGIFGVPTLLIDNELFWGDDSLEMMIAYFQDPNLFQSKTMQRLQNLPVGATRK